MEEQERKDHLERLIRSYCPNDGVSYKTVDKIIQTNQPIIYLVSVLYDGLAYGNWPWVKV